MACFLVPAAEAIVVTAVAMGMKKKEKQAASIEHKASTAADTVAAAKITTSRKLMWLAYLLWGGAFLLAYEHVWHGEVTPWFPFLTAAGDPGEAMVMLQEMATAGVCMALIVTVVWAIGVLVINKLVKKDAVPAAA
ncbi:MAG: hypothetical protein ACI3VP_06730 [Oscillospiraceae bacterium]